MDIFLLLGLIIGSFHSKARSVAALAGVWCFLLILVPGVVGKLVASHAQRSSPTHDIIRKRPNIIVNGRQDIEWTDDYYTDLKDRFVGVDRFADPLLASQIEQ